MGKLKFYYCPGHMSFAPHVILNEIGLAFEAIAVSIKEGETPPADFRRISPKGKVPVLDTGTEILTESSAIMYYLALAHPECNLLPKSAMGASRAIEWTNWLGAILAGPIGQHIHPERMTEDESAWQGVKDKGTENIIAAYAAVDERLKWRDWALSEGYSIVDPALLIFFKWGNQLKLDMLQFSYWYAHTQRMEQRPAVQATIRSENISIW